MNHCYLFIGPSGSGKTSLAEKAFAPEQKVISYTTRPPREGEEHGRDYYFVSKKKFKQMVNDDQFAEYDVYDEEFYGIAKSTLREALTAGNCYELKVTRADFYSKAKLSFIGHYNCFVLTEELYLKVLEDIPSEIGVLVYRPYTQADELPADGTFFVAKKPVKRALQVEETALTQRFMASLFREVQKAKRMSYGTSFFSTEQLYKELRRRLDEKDSLQENNYYQRFIEDVQAARIESLEEELRALEQDYDFLRQQRQVRRRSTEPLE